MRMPDSVKGPYWEPRDIWVGVYWTREYHHVARWEAWEMLLVYIVLIPCFPIKLTWGGAVPVRKGSHSGACRHSVAMALDCGDQLEAERNLAERRAYAATSSAGESDR